MYVSLQDDAKQGNDDIPVGEWFCFTEKTPIISSPCHAFLSSPVKAKQLSLRVQKGSPVSIVEKRKEKESDEAAPRWSTGQPRTHVESSRQACDLEQSLH